jgi:hypothetical protein
MEIGSGDDFVTQINDRLARASAGPIFFSRHVDASLWVRAEVNFLIHQSVLSCTVSPATVQKAGLRLVT